MIVECHHLLCFTYYRAVRHSQIRMICMYRGSALGRESSQNANMGTCFDDSDMLDKPEHDAIANISTSKSTCAKGEPLAGNSVENTNRSSENARCACSGARSTKPRPFDGKGTVNANRWTEIQPTRTSGTQKWRPFVRKYVENSDPRAEKKL